MLTLGQKLMLYAAIGLLLLYVFARPTFDQYKIKVEDSFKGLFDGIKGTFGTESTTKLENQNVILPNGDIVSPESGHTYGMPYDFFPCKENATCQSRYSVTSVCRTIDGNCIEP